MIKTLNILLAIITAAVLYVIAMATISQQYFVVSVTIFAYLGWFMAYVFMRHYFRFHTLPFLVPNNNDRRKLGLMNPGPYIIHKRDGSALDPHAEYFVLRLDDGGKDPEHVRACRIAIRAYAMNIVHHIPLLAKDLMDKYGSVR